MDGKSLQQGYKEKKKHILVEWGGARAADTIVLHFVPSCANDNYTPLIHAHVS